MTWNSDGSLGLLAISDTFNTANSQTCTYGNDDLGRIANTTCLPVGSQTPIWAQTFAYDPFGNISKNATVGISFAPVYSPATNQFSGAYDANGNLTTDSVHQYSWDADSNLISVDGITKTFDALGRVVEQLNGGTYTQILYAPWGDKVALVSVNTLQKAYVPLVGGATAVYSGTGLAYRHPDWLGSSRFASTSVQPTAVSYSGAYAPYGESYSETGTTDRSFTGQNQDTESGLYDFPTRGYSPVESRWLSPDKAGVAAANPGDPQSWNRYAYVHNKPLGAVDPLGQDGIVVFCDPNCGGSDDSTSDDSGDDSIGDDIVNTFEGIGNDIGNFFSGLFGGGGGGHSSPPPPPAKQYAQSSVSSDSAKAVQSALGSGSSVSVTNNPGIPSPAPANNADNGSIWDSCGSSCGAALSTASNFSAGAGDALTFTLDKYPRRAVSWISGMGYGEDVDHGSGAYWAGVGTGTGVGIGLSGPTGPIFGGGKAVTGGTLLNSADSLRIGWSYMRAAGIYRFRVAGTLLGPLVSRGIIASQHINLWPPSTWGW